MILPIFLLSVLSGGSSCLIEAKVIGVMEMVDNDEKMKILLLPKMIFQLIILNLEHMPPHDSTSEIFEDYKN